MQSPHQLLHFVQTTLLDHSRLVCETLDEGVRVLLFDDRRKESLLACRRALMSSVDYQARDYEWAYFLAE